MQIRAEPEKSALPICNYSQILYQFLTFTQNLKRSRFSQNIHMDKKHHLHRICGFSGSILLYEKIIYGVNGFLYKHHSQSANNSANFFQFPHPDCPHHNHPVYCNYPPVSPEIRGQKIRTA